MNKVNININTFVMAVNIDGKIHWVETPITKDELDMPIDSFAERIFNPCFSTLKDTINK